MLVTAGSRSGILCGPVAHRLRNLVLGVVGVAVLACGATVVGYRVATRATRSAAIEPPRLVITTQAPGWGAVEVERDVTLQVEDAMGGVPGVVDVESASEQGRSFVRLTFAPETAPPVMWSETRAKLSELSKLLPANAEPPILVIAGHRAARFHYTVEAPQLSGMSLRELSDGTIRQALAQITGVGEVTTCGGLVERVEVIVDPARMNALGVSLSAVIDALRRKPGITSLVEVGAFPLVSRQTAPVRIRDVASVSIGHAPTTCTASRDGADNVVMGIVALQRGADVSATLTLLATRLSELSLSLPEGVRVRPLNFSSSPSDAGKTHASSLRILLSAPTDVRHSAISEAVRRTPEVNDLVIQKGKLTRDDVIAFSGDLELLVQVDPKAKRPLRAVAAEVAGHLALIPGVCYDFSATDAELPRDLDALSLRISGPDLAELRATADQVVGVLRAIGGASGVTVARAAMAPRLSVVPDRRKLAEIGLSARDLALHIEAATDGHRAGTFQEGAKRLDLVVRLLPSGAGGGEDLQRLMVPGTGQALVPLSSVATFEARPSPSVIFRARGARFVEVRLDVRGRDPDDFLQAARRELDAEVRLPVGHTIEWKNSAR